MEVTSSRPNDTKLKAENAAFQVQKRLLENFVTMARSSVNEEMLKATLQKTLEVSNELTGAEKGSLFLLDSKGVVIDSILTRSEANKEQRSHLIGRVLDKGLAGWVSRHGKVGLITDTMKDERWLTLPDQPYSVRSALAIPIIRGDELIGILTLLHSKPNIFSEDTAEMMLVTSNQIALVLENTRLYSKLTKSYRSLDKAKQEIDEYSKALDQELEKGRKIQRDFLPADILQITGWKITSCFYPAKQVSGDFYDVFSLPGDYIALVIADVCDKGVGAALYMALFRSLIRIFSGHTLLFNEHDDSMLKVSVSEIDKISENIKESDLSIDANLNRAMNTLDLTNNYISQNHGDEGMFATVFLGILNPSTGFLTYINGGHESPLIVNPSGIRQELKPTGPAVGIIPNAKFDLKGVQIDPGEIIICYTDGVTEARSSTDELFTKKRLESFIMQHSPSVHDLLERLKNRLFTFTDNTHLSDDITMLGIYREPL
ncbi:PP2C family protein-serine/threonine phosphatase [Thermodesulfobacteriota bacterium]